MLYFYIYKGVQLYLFLSQIAEKYIKRLRYCKMGVAMVTRDDPHNTLHSHSRTAFLWVKSKS